MGSIQGIQMERKDSELVLVVVHTFLLKRCAEALLVL